MGINTIKELNKYTVEKKELPLKILQFGDGNFLRAFTDWMIDKANNMGIMNHGIVAVQPVSKTKANTLLKQDCMYHVYLEGIKDKKPIKEVVLVKSLMDVINPRLQYAEYEMLFLSEDLEMIISNTTEAGIRYEEGDDIEAMPPKSYPAKMTALLHKRFNKFKGNPDKGLLIICCELIEDNGSTLREYILKHAEVNNLGAEFINWVGTSNYFYNTLVDRIVSGFPKEDIDQIKAKIGFNDNALAKGEYFHVWAIGGDQIIKDKLPLDKAGLNVLFMDDIKDFRSKKVRILNGSHSAMVPIALQLGCETVIDAFNMPEVDKYINEMVYQEVLPVIKGDKSELKDFANKIIERFYNPYLKHYLKDIALNSLSKWETRDYPTVYDNFKLLNRFARHTSFSFAALLVLYSGKSESKDFSPNDTSEVVEFIQNSFNFNDIHGWVSGIVKNRKIWKEDFTLVPQFIDEVSKDVESILKKGMKVALAENTEF